MVACGLSMAVAICSVVWEGATAAPQLAAQSWVAADRGRLHLTRSSSGSGGSGGSGSSGGSTVPEQLARAAALAVQHTCLLEGGKAGSGPRGGYLAHTYHIVMTV